MARSGIHCFTSATLAYADRALVLAETLSRHHPEWTLWLCLVDRYPPGFSPDALMRAFDHVVMAHDLPIADFGPWVFGHDVVEACTAVKGEMLAHVLDQDGVAGVVYLDPDIALFAPLDGIVARLEGSDILLTPHLLTPEETPEAVVENEIGAMRHGIYNLGFVAVAQRDEGRRFARWWADRLHLHCIDDIPAGLFTDQRWCDHVPAFFAGAGIVHDPGCNVASWNIGHRPLSIGDDGVICAAGAPLRFFHFTKFAGVGHAMLARHSRSDGVLDEVMAWYGQALAGYRPPDLPAGWWAYGRFADGRPVQHGQRRLWRGSAGLREAVGDPFAMSFDGFEAVARLWS